MIKKTGSHNYRLISHKGHTLGSFTTKAQAVKREKQINYFKFQNKKGKK